VSILQAELQRRRPDVVVCASRGAVYMLAMWRSGIWTGPSVMINRHPDLKVTDIPHQATFILAHGSHDDVYPVKRDVLEELIRSAPRNQCMLYYTANSGEVSPGAGFTRHGDRHRMLSLLEYACLPRLVDAALCKEESPDVHFMRSWVGMLHPGRQEAENWLGYELSDLHQHWTSDPTKLEQSAQLVQLSETSEEFQKVLKIFGLGCRADCPSYYEALYPEAASVWARTRVVGIQRVENAILYEKARPVFDRTRRSMHRQGIEFEPGLHTKLLFHGTLKVNAIVQGEQGLEPLCAGQMAGTLWGKGIYFARDARYCHAAGFCPPSSKDGEKQVILCLVATGMACLGSPEHVGVLPDRCARINSQYHSAVDSLSNPEIFVSPHQGAAYPAYVITTKTR